MLQDRNVNWGGCEPESLQPRRSCQPRWLVLRYRDGDTNTEQQLSAGAVLDAVSQHEALWLWVACFHRGRCWSLAEQRVILCLPSRTGWPDNCLFPALCYKEQSGTTELWKSLGLDEWSKTSFKIMVFLSVAKAGCRILVGQGKGKEQAWSRTNVRSGGVCKSWEARDCPAWCPAFTAF